MGNSIPGSCLLNFAKSASLSQKPKMYFSLVRLNDCYSGLPDVSNYISGCLVEGL